MRRVSQAARGQFQQGLRLDHERWQRSRGQASQSECWLATFPHCKRSCYNGFCTCTVLISMETCPCAYSQQVRNELGIPVPEVLAWSSSSANPVRAEFILMEKVQGSPLTQSIGNMSAKQRIKVVQSIAEFESKFSATPFDQYGSLYYEEDCDSSRIPREGVQFIKDSHSGSFIVGPSTDRALFDNGRAKVDQHYGPCELLITTPCFLSLTS